MGGGSGGRFNCKRTSAIKFFLVGSLKIRNKTKGTIQIDKIIDFYLLRTVKKCKLDSRSLTGALIEHFPIASHSSFFIL